MSSAGRGLLDWLSDPDTGRGIEFRQPDGSWQRHGYRLLASRVTGLAAVQVAAGVRAADPVALVAESGPEFVIGFFGTLAAGATPVPLAPPGPFQSEDSYCAQLTHRLAAAGVGRLLVQRRFAGLLRRLVSMPMLELDDAEPPAAPPPANATAPPPAEAATVPAEAATVPAEKATVPAEVATVPAEKATPATVPERALVQFTSGSSGTPRPVLIERSALQANLAAIAGWLEMTPADRTATWLPFHHDMGLVGCLLAPVVCGSELLVIPPRDFVRRPESWLDCFGSRGATLTAAPGFGLAHLLRRLPPDRLAELASAAGWRFDRWRGLIVGSERIEPAVLRAFAGLLGPFGFRAETFLPAYGLAEATLAVTGVPLRAAPRTRLLDRRRLVPGQPVLDCADQDAEVELVGCGRPLVAGSSLRILDPDGRPLPAGQLGEIAVRSPSIAAGYLDPAAGSDPAVGSDAAAGSDTFAGGWLRTGDAGFLDNGELFVLGRTGDSVKRRGATVFAEDVESIAAALVGGRPAVLLGVLAGQDYAVVVAEQPAGDWAAELAGAIRRRVDGIGVLVVAGASGTIQRTTSGKPCRRLMWHRFQRGELAGSVLLDQPPALADAALSDRAPAKRT